MNHSFVVPAYGASPYLQACLESLCAQSYKSEIIISTSTPSVHIENLSKRYQTKLYVHSPNCGIAHDWNVAVAQATTEWVTLAHQDDIYYPEFTERTIAALSKCPDAIMAFSSYEEIFGELPRRASELLIIKRILLEIGFLGRSSIRSDFSKTNCLRFGCSIPCPAATINKIRAPFDFDDSLLVDLDWAAWLHLCSLPGSFVWVRGNPLMAHRIHEFSETSAGIERGYRATEDGIILRRIWPKFVASLILRAYRFAYTSNSGI